MQLHRLQGRKRSAHVLRKGRMWKGKTMTIRVLPGVPASHGMPTPFPEGVYLGTFASTSLDASAVRRNRMRRRCREALRVAVQQAPRLRSAQLLLTPRSASLDAPFATIQEDVAAFLSQLRP